MIHLSTSVCRRRIHTSKSYPLDVIQLIQDENLSWANRLELQQRWTNPEKGWMAPVEWKNTSYGIGLFAREKIAKDTLIRKGIIGKNLMRFTTVGCVSSFLGSESSPQYNGRLEYFADYFWGFNPHGEDEDVSADHESWFYGMWIPGNGLNHFRESNTVYRAEWRDASNIHGINLVATREIEEGEELFDDYRRHGNVPTWLLPFKEKAGVDLNFADCNQFVS